tara:strand:+ start:6645 stop:6926 length:282 start_codon:yes stop_codon:yes gene_type:complete
MSFISSIEKDLQLKKYKGKVIFDLLCVNRDSSNRFYEADFNGYNLDLSEGRGSVIQPSYQLVDYQFDFYKRHIEFLKNSTLSKRCQKRFLKVA